MNREALVKRELTHTCIGEQFRLIARVADVLFTIGRSCDDGVQLLLGRSIIDDWPDVLARTGIPINEHLIHCVMPELHHCYVVS